MPVKVTDAQRKELETTGMAVTGYIGGQPKQAYWTPDGRQIMAMPDIHEFSRKDASGKIVETGTRDANLDKGWLTQKPKKLKPYCAGCDRWHDTKAQVDKCIADKHDFTERMARTAKNQLKQDEPNDRIDKLETDMSEIKTMLKKLLEK